MTMTDRFWNQMLKLQAKAIALRDDDDGAALVEYTVLLGLMLVATIASIVTAGNYVSSKWTALNTALTP